MLNFASLRMPATQGVDLSGLSAQIERASEIRRQQEEENRKRMTMAEISKAASGGDYTGARDAAFRMGELSTGLAFQKQVDAMEQDRQQAAERSQARSERSALLNDKRMMETMKMVGSVVASTKSDEEYVTAIDGLSRLTGRDLSKYRDPSLKSVIVGELSGDASSRMTPYQKARIALDAKKLQMEQEANSRKTSLTEGEKAKDKVFAKTYEDFITGGAADFEKNLTQLRQVQDTLSDKNNYGELSGPIVGKIPDFLYSFTPAGQRAIDTREQVEEIVQRNLKEVLGAQFTQKEGDRLIARAYNPQVDEKINQQRLGRLINQIEDAYNARRAAAQHFEKYGTIKGFSGKMPTLEDFYRATEDTGKDQERVSPSKKPDQQKTVSPESDPLGLFQ